MKFFFSSSPVGTCCPVPHVPLPGSLQKLTLLLCPFLNGVQAAGRLMMFFFNFCISLFSDGGGLHAMLCVPLDDHLQEAALSMQRLGVEIKRKSLGLAVNEPLNPHTGS